MRDKALLKMINEKVSEGLKIAVNYSRVSTIKQADQGDSLEYQDYLCNLEAEKDGYYILKSFKESYTGTSTDRLVWKDLLKFCDHFSAHIDRVYILDLDRFNRGGAETYMTLRNQLSKLGIELKDTRGVIQKERNTLEHLNFQYWWSSYRPSETAEFLKAQSDKEEVRKILTRIIGSQINLTQKGYWTRPAPIGFKTSRVEDDAMKKRTILLPDEKESLWITEMFKRRASGIYTDEDIVQYINDIGYKTRSYKSRDRVTREIKGIRGGKLLDIKSLQKIIERPIYAGIICQKWTNSKPIKAQFKGLVSIDLWNKANKGKYLIIEVKNEYSISKNSKLYPKMKQKRQKKNPMFPLKMVLCPFCQKPFLGSSSRGKSGKYFPSYHCSRGHARYSVPKAEFENTIINYFKTLKLSSETRKVVEIRIMQQWKQHLLKQTKNVITSQKKVLALQEEQENLYNKIKMLSSPVVLKKIEEEIEDITVKIEFLKKNRTLQEIKESDLIVYINFAKFFMEHLEKLFINTVEMEKQEKLFELVFETMPTYEELKNGTPVLTPILAIFQEINNKKKLWAPPESFCWNTLFANISKIHTFLRDIHSITDIQLPIY